MLVFRVADNGVGMSAEKLAAVRASLQAPAAGPGRNGYGLSNVQERIQLSFGLDYGLRFESSPGAGTTVELLHPLVMPEDA
jgi:two-component system sensor histidine kinase YesM